jgi:hypothetical protein
MKTFNQLDEKDAPNIHRMLSSEEKELRSILLKKIIKTPGIVHPSDITPQENGTGINVLSTLKGLENKGLAAMRDDGSVTGVYPFSALPTSHQVKLENGSSVFAMCAIDSLGIAYELKQNVTVTSSCSHCRGHIVIEIINGEVSRVEPGSALALHVTLGDYKDWASTC